jgi:hypothetical protein
MRAVSRRIDFEAEALIVRFTGLAAITTLTRKIRVPYTAIGSMSIGLTDPPGLLALKVGLSTPPFGTTQRGRFREHGRWSFLDVDDRERAVVLDLTGHEYRRVVLTVDDPQALIEKLGERVRGRG